MSLLIATAIKRFAPPERPPWAGSFLKRVAPTERRTLSTKSLLTNSTCSNEKRYKKTLPVRFVRAGLDAVQCCLWRPGST